MKSVVKILKLGIKYGGIIFAIIEIVEFAVERLEKFSQEASNTKLEEKKGTEKLK